MNNYNKILFLILVIVLLAILGCKEVSKENISKVSQITTKPKAEASNSVLCGDWPDKKIALMSTKTDFATPYQNSQLVGVTPYNFFFYCSSDSLDTISNFFKSYGYIEKSNFQEDDPLGYQSVKNFAGSRNFKGITMGADATRTFPPFNTFVLFEAGSGKSVIVAYH